MHKNLKTGLGITAAAAVPGMVLAGELAWAHRHIDSEWTPSERGPYRYGKRGPALTYWVFGDSLAAGMGASHHEKAMAWRTARSLGEVCQVELTNFAVCGARAADVWQRQLPEASRDFRGQAPDLIMISVGGNDALHLFRHPGARVSIELDYDRLFGGLHERWPEAEVVLTGAPDMSSTPRAKQPLRRLVARQAPIVNEQIRQVAEYYAAEHAFHVINAPVAQLAGPEVRERAHECFAVDQFHPNDTGHAIGADAIQSYLDVAACNALSKLSAATATDDGYGYPLAA